MFEHLWCRSSQFRPPFSVGRWCVWWSARTESSYEDPVRQILRSSYQMWRVLHARLIWLCTHCSKAARLRWCRRLTSRWFFLSFFPWCFVFWSFIIVFVCGFVLVRFDLIYLLLFWFILFSIVIIYIDFVKNIPKFVKKFYQFKTILSKNTKKICKILNREYNYFGFICIKSKWNSLSLEIITMIKT